MNQSLNLVLHLWFWIGHNHLVTIDKYTYWNQKLIVELIMITYLILDFGQKWWHFQFLTKKIMIFFLDLIEIDDLFSNCWSKNKEDWKLKENYDCHFCCHCLSKKKNELCILLEIIFFTCTSMYLLGKLFLFYIIAFHVTFHKTFDEN